MASKTQIANLGLAEAREVLINGDIDTSTQAIAETAFLRLLLHPGDGHLADGLARSRLCRAHRQLHDSPVGRGWTGIGCRRTVTDDAGRTAPGRREPSGARGRF